MVRLTMTQDEKTLETRGEYAVAYVFKDTEGETVCQTITGGEISYPDLMVALGVGTATRIVDAGKKMGMSDRRIISSVQFFSEHIMKEAIREIKRRNYDKSKNF